MSDYPFNEIAEAVFHHLKLGHHIHQKWTCRHCGSRQTMATPDLLYKSGRCEECNNISIIDRCNFVLLIGTTSFSEE